ncbi:MAG: DEAD/DEAH box helicase [Alphaproteobacteria bacterium]|nr:DEAD/DEAH box helicase [Alphaproteobacteria bacterium]
MTTFAELGLAEPLLQALAACGYDTPTPIQAQAIPPLLNGQDVLGCAQTGTGKTAAFTLPVLQHLSKDRASGRRRVRCLVLTPTRELAAQIGESVKTYGRGLRLRHHVIFGGVGQSSQVEALQRGVDLLIACPGRLLDLHGQGHVDLRAVDFFVLDEADRMLDMGFIHDVRKVLKKLPKDRQNLLFSATLPEAVVELASGFLTDPVHIEVTPEAPTVERIEQSVMFVAKADKRRLLAHLLRDADVEQAIVFTRTKHGANRLVQHLDRDGIEAMAIHGNKSQNARTRALEAFRSGECSVLVATDVASRGIDIDGISHVFNFDLPNEPESYVHRIGRTARAGRDGVAVAFCDDSEGRYLRDIEALIGERIPVDRDHRWHAEALIPGMNPPKPKGQPGGGGGGGGGQRRGRGGGGGGGGGGRSGGRGGRPQASSGPAASATGSASKRRRQPRRRGA